MPKLDMNSFAKEVSKVEGGKVNLTIAQIKEVLKKAQAVVAEQPAYISVVIANLTGEKKKK